MAVMDPRADFARQLFNALDRNRIAFCAVGDTGQLPYSIPSDLDLIVDEVAAAALPRLLFDLARRTETRLVHMIWYQRKARCFIIAGMALDRRLWFLSVDFSCGYGERGRSLLSSVELLNGRRGAVATNGDPRGFATPAPASEFIYYLLKKIEKQTLTERQAQYLSLAFTQEPAGAVSQLHRFWCEADAELIAHAGASGDWSRVRQRLPGLRAALHDARPISWFARLREAPRVIDRLVRPTGLWVVFLGPDGSGKSTILSRVATEIAPALRGTKIFHLRAPLLASGRVRPVTDPHSRRPRRAVLSLVQVLVNAGRCWLGYWLRVWPALVRSSFVGFDRYYHDILVDPRRYRYGGPRWFARLTCALVPKPDLWILLDAPAPVIWSRKKEIPMAEIARQRSCYQELAARLPGGRIVDASRPPDQVAHAVERITFDFLAARTARRLGLGAP